MTAAYRNSSFTDNLNTTSNTVQTIYLFSKDSLFYIPIRFLCLCAV